MASQKKAKSLFINGLGAFAPCPEGTFLPYRENGFPLAAFPAALIRSQSVSLAQNVPVAGF